MELNSIGLSAEKSLALSNDLNELLANFQRYYQNLRGIHWNIRGKRFFDLHVKFEELYNDANIKVDEIAERILTLGGVPLHTYEDYIVHMFLINSRFFLPLFKNTKILFRIQLYFYAIKKNNRS